MQDQQKELVDRIKQAQNVLVTVSSNPSVDQLAAAVGLTLVLNHIGKHGTAVFSGEVPSTIDFLRPEETLEKTTDSLRDFIIALDKSKADKLRYKVEDDVVRIFITPYKTSISDKDLDFSQGDFNVDVVIGLGVTNQQDLDSAITAHGRILHDATVASISTVSSGDLATINWVNTNASSLSEMTVSLVDALDKSALDNQVATALLTGIVSSTERFSNDKTSPQTMSVSAELMAAGANQQLIVTELEAPAPEPAAVEPTMVEDNVSDQAPEVEPEADKPKPEPGTLEISHEVDSESHDAESESTPSDDAQEEEHYEAPPAEPETPPEPGPQVDVDENGNLKTIDSPMQSATDAVTGALLGGDSATTTTHDQIIESSHQRVGDANDTDPFGKLTANTQPEAYDPPAADLTAPNNSIPMLSHDGPAQPPVMPMPPTNIPEPQEVSQPAADAALSPMPPVWQPPQDPVQPATDAATPQTPSAWQPPADLPQAGALPQISPDETLFEIEKSVDSPHLDLPLKPISQEPQAPEAVVDDARNAVEEALKGAPLPLEPNQSTGAQTVFDDAESLAPNLPPAQTPLPNTGFSEPTPGNTPADDTLDMPLPPSAFGQPAAAPFPGGDASAQPFPAPTTPSPFQPAPLSSLPPLTGQQPTQQASQSSDPNSPPPVPPPMLPPLQ